ncbi:MAG: UDP-N-acetylmuramate--alanine ligase [Planctomycetota bacterium]|jgi:UDP-N-acetylmuramate--alanine ligase
MKSAPPFHQKKVHLVGIGGIGMSALAIVLQEHGSVVSGSDAGAGEQLPRLAAGGIEVFTGHSLQHLPSDADCLVTTAAIGEGNPEVEEAHRRGIPVFSYAQALGRVSKAWETTAVAGTHGKTTTAAMLTWILIVAKRDPSAVIGGIVPQLGGNALCGKGGAMVVEACEFNRSFLELDPLHAVITNVADDHLDYYGSSDQLRAAFRNFATNVRAEGILVTPALVARDLDLRGAVKGRLVTIGNKPRDVQILRATAGFRIRMPESGETPVISMKMPGKHNEVNATAAAVIAHVGYGVDLKTIGKALNGFDGVERRFRILRNDDHAVVIDDYAHHPEEIEATLLTAKEMYPDRRLVAVFQPHLADRVRRQQSGFLNALSYADELFLVRDYRVLGRDEDGRNGAQRLTDAMTSLNMKHVFCQDLEGCSRLVGERHKPRDVVCVMGAGDVGEVSLELAREL